MTKFLLILYISDCSCNIYTLNCYIDHYSYEISFIILNQLLIVCRFKRRLLLSEAQEENVQPPKSSKPVLTDAHKLLQRQKQVDIGKNTLSYGRFIAAVPR